MTIVNYISNNIEEDVRRTRFDLYVFMSFNIFADQMRIVDYGWVSWSV